MAFVQENLLLIAVAFLSGAMLVWPLVQRRLTPGKPIGTLGATHLINTRDAILVDVREPKEMQGGRVPNAIHIPLSQLESRSGELGRHAGHPVIAYCDTGTRGRMAGSALAKAGFGEIYHLNGGFRAWKEAGLPVESHT
jgi:rhodanese-related sulfurtransferase